MQCALPSALPARMARLIAFRPPRIAMSLAILAAAAQAVVGARIHPALPVPGVLLGAAGFGLMLRAWWLFRRADTAICPTAGSSALVTRDVFSLTRNPMYLGMTGMLAGLAIAVGTAPFYVAAAGFALAMDRVFCRYEEAKALAEFGADYAAYSRCVRRWL